MKTTKKALLPILLLALAPSACDDRNDGDVRDPHAILDEVAEKEIVAVDTNPDTEPGWLKRVRVTGIIPGTAYVEADIENPYSGDPEAIAAGERHFKAFNCSGCHAPEGGGGMGPPLSDDVWIYGNEPAQIYATIMQGRPAGMPAFSSMVTDKIVWEIAAYLEDLGDIQNYAAADGFKENTFGYRKEKGEKPNN